MKIICSQVSFSAYPPLCEVSFPSQEINYSFNKIKSTTELLHYTNLLPFLGKDYYWGWVPEGQRDHSGGGFCFGLVFFKATILSSRIIPLLRWHNWALYLYLDEHNEQKQWLPEAHFRWWLSAMKKSNSTCMDFGDANSVLGSFPAAWAMRYQRETRKISPCLQVMEALRSKRNHEAAEGHEEEWSGASRNGTLHWC